MAAHTVVSEALTGVTNLDMVINTIQGSMKLSLWIGRAMQLLASEYLEEFKVFKKLNINYPSIDDLLETVGRYKSIRMAWSVSNFWRLMSFYRISRNRSQHSLNCIIISNKHPVTYTQSSEYCFQVPHYRKNCSYFIPSTSSHHHLPCAPLIKHWTLCVNIPRVFRSSIDEALLFPVDLLLIHPIPISPATTLVLMIPADSHFTLSTVIAFQSPIKGRWTDDRSRMNNQGWPFVTCRLE